MGTKQATVFGFWPSLVVVVSWMFFTGRHLYRHEWAISAADAVCVMIWSFIFLAEYRARKVQ